jgi:ABC-type nitrate/sulfonate/bicarbonate transport system permease component
MSAQVQLAPAPVASPDRSRRHRILNTTVPRVLAVVLFLGSWQLIAPHLSTALIPQPTDIARTMLDELRGDTLAPATVYASFGITLARLLVGQDRRHAP